MNIIMMLVKLIPTTDPILSAESITFYFNCHIISTVKNRVGSPSKAYKSIKESRNIRWT